MARLSALFLTLSLILVIPRIALADDYVGTFAGQLNGEEYRLTIESGASNRYEGELLVAEIRFAIAARRFGETVLGQIASPDGFVGITLSLQGNRLRLEDEHGEVIVFERVD